MPFKPSDPLPPALHAQILAGDLEAVAASYDRLTPDPDGLLMGIAARAASSRQVAILEWTFLRGLQLPRRSVNHVLYHCATGSKSPDVWRVLFAHGYDFNAHQSEVGDALSDAIWDGDVALATFLLEEGGADPNRAGGSDMLECGTCAFRGEHTERAPELLRLLLRHGWKPTVRWPDVGSRGGTTIAAAELGLLDELRVLVEEGGADIEPAEPWFTGEPDGGDHWAWGTPLYRAAYRGQEATVAYLLDRGADPTFKDDKGRSCLWAARHGGNDKVVQMFVDRGITSEGGSVE